MISLLHPSRQRPEKSRETIKKWISRAGSNDIEVIQSLDTDDPLLSKYAGDYIVNPNKSAVEAINNAARAARGDIMIVVSDDTDCPVNWYDQIMEAVSGKRDYILKVYDGIQKWIITMPVMDRAYYDRFGYVYHPDFRHMFCDTWLTHQAEALGRIIVRNDILFQHNHYCVGKSKRDEINTRADSTWEQGKAVYLKLVREHFRKGGDFGINSSHATQHIQWLKRTLR